MSSMDRRLFIKAAGIAAAASMVPSSAFPGRTFDAAVDETLFETINRIKDPENPTGVELHHAPYFKVPDKVEAGRPFMVEISVGRELHVVSPAHRITEVTLLAGNEPVGTALLSDRYAQPRVSFLVAVDKPFTLVAQARCNLHGLWEGSVDVVPHQPA